MYPCRYLLGGSGCCNLWSACQAEVDGLLSGSKGTGLLVRIVNLMRLQVGRRSSLGDELLCQWWRNDAIVLGKDCWSSGVG